MFGATNLYQPKNVTQPLVMMVETFRRSDIHIYIYFDAKEHKFKDFFLKQNSVCSE